MTKISFPKILLFFCLCCVLQSCDWLRSNLGMPTSVELNAIREELAEEKLAEQKKLSAVKDSLNDSLVDSTITSKDLKDSIQTMSLANVQNIGCRYYIVMGAYREKTNIEKMTNMLIKHGEKPISIEKKNGTIMVCAGGANSMNEAKSNLVRIENLALSSDALWIYDSNR